jgi:hypothetical protein
MDVTALELELFSLDDFPLHDNDIADLLATLES